MEDRDLEFVSTLAQHTNSKILLLVADGLGGLGHPDFDHQTELEYATTPNLDRFISMRTTATGLLYPVDRGITPGSGPGHLGLFGYDPLNEKYNIGRGVLDAAGLDFTLEKRDLIFRVNLCRVAPDGAILDRRAGRISTDESSRICEKLTRQADLPDAQVFVLPTRDHRAVLIIRSDQILSDRLADTDPQYEGMRPLPCEPLDSTDPVAARTASLVNTFLARAAELLHNEPKANMIVLRGASRLPDLPKMGEVYRLRAAGTSIYPTYRGVARLAGMDILQGPTTLDEQLRLVGEHFAEYEFFFVHFKDTDSAGEDGDFLRKVKAIEYLDQHFPMLLDMKFDVIAITGDHSSPSCMRSHSWHSVPLAIHAPLMRRDDTRRLTEYECAKGSLGRLKGRELMKILVANAGKLKKYGA